MKTGLKIIGMIAAILLAYLLLWPVPINPVSWNAPVSKGFTGDFAPNTRLVDAERLSIGDFHGPEDLVLATENGREIAYTTSQNGAILRVDTQANTSAVFAQTGGVPLGIERGLDGSFLVADAHLGLLQISADGKTVTVLTDTVDGSPILYADDLDVAANGMIYVSDASTKFGAKASGSTMAGSLLELMEHGKTGRLLSYDPATQITAIVNEGYSFSNGIAMCPDDACVLVNETGAYAIRRVWLTGPRAGTKDTLVDNLPGFPDNINPGALIDGKQTYWLGLASPRSKALDDLSEKPFMRKLSQRLPASMRPKAALYGCVIQIDENGAVLQTLQDPSGGYPVTTGAIEGRDHLYITSLEAHDLARVAYAQ